MTYASIRAYQATDIAQFYELMRGKAIFDGGERKLTATPDDIALALAGSPPKMHAIVAQRSGQLIGMAIYFPVFSSFLAKPGYWLDDLFVLEDHRAQGVGRALLDEVCALAKANGCARVDWLVSKENTNGGLFTNALVQLSMKKADWYA